MQQVTASCPRCDQPLGISWDMWGKYYVCAECGFAADDDDQLIANGKKPQPTLSPEVIDIETWRTWPLVPRR